MSEIRVDTISEKTSANGVAIDGVTLKDGGGTFTSPVLVPDGSTSAVSLGNDGDPNTGIYFQAADSLGLVLGGSRKLSASSTGVTIENGALSAKGGAIFNEDSADVDFRVESNGDANMLFVDGGNNAVGIATNSPVLANGRGMVVHGGSSVARVELRNDTSGAAATDGMFLTYSGNDAFVGNREAGTIQFWNNGSERARIESDGDVLIGTTSTTINSSNAGIALRYYGEVKIARTDAGASSPVLDVYGQAGQFKVMGDGDAENTNNRYSGLSDERIKTNITDANSQWNDIKAIEVKNFERKDDVAKYGAGKKVQIGVVAQQVESVSPGLVKDRDPTEVEINMSSEFGTLYIADDAETKDGNDAVLYVADDQEVIDGEKNVDDIKTEATHSKKVGDIKEVKDQVKSVGYSVLYMKAIKALQEAMTRIETLETEVTALKG